jgi:hypothetical protein
VLKTAPTGTCGNWNTGPGNSPKPPASVPAIMGLIVTSKVSQSGSTIAGNEVRIAVVQTDPGYAPNPGHEGTGTVLAVISC